MQAYDAQGGGPDDLRSRIEAEDPSLAFHVSRETLHASFSRASLWRRPSEGRDGLDRLLQGEGGRIDIDTSLAQEPHQLGHKRRGKAEAFQPLDAPEDGRRGIIRHDPPFVHDDDTVGPGHLFHMVGDVDRW